MSFIRLGTFDTWQPGFALAQITVYKAGTTTEATLYDSEDLSGTLDNPQVLESLTDNGIHYGRWSQPIYVNEAVELVINGVDRTGVIRPALTTLSGEDASEAVATVDGGTEEHTIGEFLARFVDVRDFGDWTDDTAATNTTTLTSAIGTVSGDGGGYVLVPAGTWPFNTISIPANVVLRGAGRGATILQSSVGDEVVTLAGDRAGLSRLTLDGISVVADSVGVWAKAVNEIVMDDVEVKRFQRGIKLLGGRRCQWDSLTIENCEIGVEFRGDNDASGGADGDECRDNAWIRGHVTNCTTVGVRFEYVDMLCAHNTLRDVVFEDNTGTAIEIIGSRFTELLHCAWDGNLVNLTVEDDDPVNTENTIVGLRVTGGRMSEGEMRLEDNLVDVVFQRVEFAAVEISLTVPGNNVLALDCTEDADTVLSAGGTYWQRRRTTGRGATVGTTTDATPTTAWQFSPEPGQLMYAEAKVLGNQVNGTNTAEYHISVSAKRAGAELDYINQTANFTVGEVITGATSGATAIVIADVDGGATGTLTLRSIVGTFEDGETITDPLGGSAEVSGTVSSPAVSLLGTVEAIRAAREDVAGWDATFVASGADLLLQVTGAAATTVEWFVDVDLTTP